MKIQNSQLRYALEMDKLADDAMVEEQLQIGQPEPERHGRGSRS